MSIINRLISKFEEFQSRPKFSLWRTLYLNLRTLPVKTALKMPLLVYGKIQLANLEGKIVIKDQNKKIKWGYNYAGYRNTGCGRIYLEKNSKIIIGSGVKISQGVSIVVKSNATLELDEFCSLGDSSTVICYRKIYIGKHSGITWECQVMDFNSHFIQFDENQINTIFKPIYIGNFCWIGNRTSIMPGTRLPDRIIVTSNSLLNKNYDKTIPSYTLIGGIPAKLLRANVKRIYDKEVEKKLFSMFSGEQLSIFLNE